MEFMHIFCLNLKNEAIPSCVRVYHKVISFLESFTPQIMRLLRISRSYYRSFMRTILFVYDVLIRAPISSLSLGVNEAIMSRGDVELCF